VVATYTNPPDVAIVLIKLMCENKLDEICIWEFKDGNTVMAPPIVELVVAFSTVQLTTIKHTSSGDVSDVYIAP
jgi:hypothetical protein